MKRLKAYGLRPLFCRVMLPAAQVKPRPFAGLRPLLFTCLLLRCFFSMPTLKAQPPIGIKLGAGLAFPHMEVQPVGNGESWTPEKKYGVVFGLFTQVHLHARWVFQPALQYVLKGYGERHVSTTYNYNFVYKENLPYIEVPLNLLHAPQPEGNGFLIGGGPAVGFLWRRRYGAGGVKDVDVGINAMVGYKMPIGFSLNLNYTYGLLNVREQATYVQVQRNRFLALTVGYLF